MAHDLLQKLTLSRRKGVIRQPLYGDLPNPLIVWR